MGKCIKPQQCIQQSIQQRVHQCIQPQLWRVRGYVPPAPGTSAFRTHLRSKTPFNGRLVQQRLVDVKTKEPYMAEGRLLRTQCPVRTQDGRRCRNTTSYDYTMCNVHLLRQRKLVIAPSRIPGASLGLFVADVNELRKHGRDALGRPKPSAHVVYKKGARVGGKGCVFLGEMLPDDELLERYPYPNGGEYALDMDAGYSCDEFLARTALSYSNDCIDLQHPKLARNYYTNYGEPAKSTKQLPIVANAEAERYYHGGVYNVGHCDTGLVALVPLCHGVEVYWSYTGEYGNVKSRDGTHVADQYWGAINRALFERE